jgi:hypothetical protein
MDVAWGSTTTRLVPLSLTLKSAWTAKKLFVTGTLPINALLGLGNAMYAPWMVIARSVVTSELIHFVGIVEQLAKEE